MAWIAVDVHISFQLSTPDRIYEFLDCLRDEPGKPRVDNRRVISGILHVLKTGCRWRDVPPEYGPATTIYNRYNRWSQRGLWAAPVRADCSFWRCSSRTQPRQFAREGAPLGSRRKRGEWAQAVGRSRGGRTSKIHCLADDRGRPVAFALTPGNVADISMA